MKKNTFFGKVIIVGRTNVGKSTLLNKLIKSNISIISHKKNTTQTHITGVYTSNLTQFELIDSPGLKNNYTNNIEKKKLRDTFNLINEMNIIIFLISGFIWSKEENRLLKYIKKNNNNYIIVINKIDLIDDKKLLLPFILKISKLTSNKEIFLISAKKNIYLKNLLIYIKKKIPISNHAHVNKKKTTCTKQFLVTEIIRETLINLLNKELVYSFTVFITDFYKNIKNKYIILSIIFIKNIRHKKIIIGNKGGKIKKCKIQSQYKIEKLFQKKIYLNIKVKIK
ncbi:GTPase Era [Buchnera aphidicola (Cinara piceae)]|uniref:GTPase Era n=1 Tax=Buchnera aphidicola (Cinara piceae) TaxID=1660043 RepID=A0A803GCL0_9GAMM|nr:GTPase Era [Buchnera aphidicola]VFP88228.1 GTPase Era [Buchnera aphidicola (Cinara piceae)]